MVVSVCAIFLAIVLYMLGVKAENDGDYAKCEWYLKIGEYCSWIPLVIYFLFLMK